MEQNGSEVRSSLSLPNKSSIDKFLNINDVSVRWMIRRDMPEVINIDELSFPNCPWGEDLFLCHLRDRDTVGMVAECYQGELKGAILGFMVYQLKKGYMDLLTLAVHPWVRRKGVGTKLTDKIKNKVTATNRTSVQLKVRESNLETQLFLRKTGFFCKGTVADFYFDGFHTENAYEFEYRIPIDDLL